MGNSTGWYDPVCYQFYFCAVGDEEAPQSLIDAGRRFAEEMSECYALWLSLGGRVLGQSWRGYPCRMDMILSEDDMERFRDLLSVPDYDCWELTLIPGKTLARFAAPTRSIDRTWRDQTAKFTDMKQFETADRAEQAAWYCRQMTCPTDDLRGVWFPKSCFVPGHLPLGISYMRCSAEGTLAYVGEILRDCDRGAKRASYLYILRASVPRYFLDALNRPFAMQNAWRERLEALCGSFENAMGTLKMDACELEHGSPVLTGNSSFIPGFSQYLPDLAWGTALTRRQIDALGGVEALRETNVFREIHVLANGNAFLQLTSDISQMTKAEAAGLWRVAAPHLRTVQSCAWSVGDVPPSFRWGFEPERFQMDDYGQYRIQM